MTLSEREEYLRDNPNIMQIITKPNGFIAGHGQKPDHEFRNLLKEIKKANPGSNIDTF